jgi:deoxyribodipyrimidine photo-lyase
MSTHPVILWFRNDLRLADQSAVHEAANSGAKVIALFILDQSVPWAPGAAALWWLHHSLSALAQSLAERDCPLILRRGDSASILGDIVRQTGARAVYTGGSAEPTARAIDRAVAESLRKLDCTFHRLRTTTLFHPDSIKTKTGGAYSVYTPFANACLALGGPKDLLAAPKSIPAGPHLQSDRLADWKLLPVKPDWAERFSEIWTPGEAAALDQAKHFVTKRLDHYLAARDRPADDGTSMLSPHLHFGEISAPTVWQLAHRQPASKGRDMLVRELIWREFSHNLLWHHPQLPDEPLREEFAKFPWRHDKAGLRAWQKGLTGVPIVDAGMRQLWRFGWMHNRVRMIVASFLVKHLLIPWQDGEAWFWDTLVDGDLANNATNWQWVAGCGADAAPYFRIFNPVLQGKKFDPDGAYVRHHVPELAKLESRYIHAPWEASSQSLKAAKVVLGETYPAPIVDLREGRERALAGFSQIRARA